jgi:hypothetical protein
MGAVVVVVITLVAAWGLGWHTWVTGVAPYKDFFYPSTEPQILFSQTVQLTNECVGLVGGGFCLAAIALWRWWHRGETADVS